MGRTASASRRPRPSRRARAGMSWASSIRRSTPRTWSSTSGPTGRSASLYDLDRWTFAAAGTSADPLRPDRHDLHGDPLQADRPERLGRLHRPGHRARSCSRCPSPDATRWKRTRTEATRAVTPSRSRRFNPTALQLGVPYTGSLTGSGFVQVFKVDVPQDNPLLIDLDAGSDSVHTEVYARRGAPPTRREYDFSSVAAGADQQILRSSGRDRHLVLPRLRRVGAGREPVHPAGLQRPGLPHRADSRSLWRRSDGHADSLGERVPAGDASRSGRVRWGGPPGPVGGRRMRSTG